MSDNDFAAIVYCLIFVKKEADGDMYVRGILEAVKKLEERKRLALEYHYRDGMTYKQAGEKIGVSTSYARTLANEAILKLKRPSQTRDMSVIRLIIERNRLLNDLKELSHGISERIRIIIEKSY